MPSHESCCSGDVPQNTGSQSRRILKSFFGFAGFFWIYIYRLRARLSIDYKKSRFGGNNRQIYLWEQRPLRICAPCGISKMASIFAAGPSKRLSGSFSAT